jgi:O-methyltransferase involved in polyketide biosynthesis
MRMAAATGGIRPELAGVPETMLWSLYHRACEAQRPDAVLVDPESVRIHAALDYDFAGHFGAPVGSLAVRAAAIDGLLRRWLLRHPDGLIVSLGEGLETQASRIDNGRMRWLSVDLPEAIRLRALFIPHNERFGWIAANVMDFAWMAAIEPGEPVFFVAQGLLMYLPPADVRALLRGIADRFGRTDIVFDAVPRWFSQLTLMGWQQTSLYRLPPMPWGIDRNEIAATLQEWHPAFDRVAFLDYRMPRGLPLLLAKMTARMPGARHEVPTLVHIERAEELSHPREVSVTLSHENAGGPAGNAMANRNPDMTSTDADAPEAATISGVFAAARRNAGQTGELAVTAGQVIARRVALGVAAAFDPLAADHVEFARMVPEKMEAFSAAGAIMLEQSHAANLTLTRSASEAVASTARATMRMADSLTPAAFAQAQASFALAWMQGTVAHCLALGMLAVTAQAAAMAPIRATVASNMARLGT